jgi:hypothetical protein
MKRILNSALLAPICVSSAWAQDVDPNGPDIPIVTRDPDGGILDTGDVYTRSEYRKFHGWHAKGKSYLEKYGYPRAVVETNGKSPVGVFAGETTTLEQIDKKFNGDGVVGVDFDGVDSPEMEIFDDFERVGGLDHDPDGPGIPYVTLDTGGGIVRRGDRMSRAKYRQLIKKNGAEVHLRKHGYATVILISEQGIKAHFADSPEALDQRLGGDGVVLDGDLELNKAQPAKEIDIFDGDAPIDKRPDAIDLDAVAAAKGPIELFDGIYNTITLKDGRWYSKVGDIQVAGCPPGVAEAASAHALASFDRNVTFSAPWHPSDFGASFAQFSWRAVGANGYFSEIFDLGEAAPGSGMDLSVTAALNPVSPDKIDVWTRVQLQLSPMLAHLSGGTKSCTAIARGKYKLAN